MVVSVGDEEVDTGHRERLREIGSPATDLSNPNQGHDTSPSVAPLLDLGRSDAGVGGEPMGLQPVGLAEAPRPIDLALTPSSADC